MMKISLEAFRDEMEKIAARPPDSVINVAKMVLDNKGLDLHSMFGKKLPPHLSLPEVLSNARGYLTEAGGHDAMAAAPSNPNMDTLIKGLEDARKAHLNPANSESARAYSLGAFNASAKQIADHVDKSKWRTAGTIGALIGGTMLINHAVKKYRERKQREEMGL